MKTRAQIQFDFDQAMRRANEIDELGADLSKIARKDMENTQAELLAAWKGDSARLFQSKANKLQTQVNRTAAELNGIADSIRIIARIIYEAEMEALRIATQRT